MFSSIASLGIPSAVQRFLGKSFAEQNTKELRSYVIVSFLVVSLGILGVSSIIFLTQHALAALVQLDSLLVLFSIVMVCSSTLVVLLRSVLISILKTKTLLIVMILSSVLKFLIAVSLIYSGTGAIGLMIGFTSQHVISSVALGLVILVTTKFVPISISEIREKTGRLFSAGLANWIPLFVSTISSQLGTVVVFGLQGAGQAGTYFIAFSVLSAVTGVMYSLFSVTYPVLSGMNDGRKRLTLKIIKLSLVLSLPLGSSLIFYSDQVMVLLGNEYASAALPLSTLLLSLVPVAIATGVGNLVYAYGSYRQVLGIGLATNLPRAILYFPLVDMAGGSGAAVAFTIGSVIGLVVSMIVSRRIGLRLQGKMYAAMFALPIASGFGLSYLDVPYFVGVPLTVLVSYLGLFKMRIMNEADIRELEDVLPRRVSDNAMRMFSLLKRARLSSAT
jgi:O-antigen/teichoic acid export membrane protein